MAKIVNNILIRGMTGSLGGQIILKSGKGGQTIVCAKTNDMNKRKPTPAQLAHQQSFREAALYASEAQREEIYLAKAKGKAKSPYNVALADWFRKPRILQVNQSGWSGGSSGLIRVQALDDVKVAQVSVRISDETGVTLEEGPAVEAGASWWEYTTRSSFSGRLIVTVSAKDLPGNVVAWREERVV